MAHSKTIQAYAIHQLNGRFQPYSYDVGALEDHEVEIDVLHCGICHSDLSMVDNEWGATRFPLVAGHEVIGKIAAKGRQVHGLKEGTVVGLGWHSGYCGHCQCCQSGDNNLCDAVQPTIIGRHGGFAEKVRADAASVVVIPDGIELASAGPLLCAGITVFNPLVQFDIAPTAKVAVIGIGGLGHLALQFLNAWGCEVTAFTSSEAKRSQALALGAHNTLNSRDSEQIKAAANRFDLIIATVNVALDWNLYLSTLKAKGRLHFVGAILEPLNVSVMGMMLKQRSVSSSTVGSPLTMTRMLEFARLHDIKPVVESFAMSQINEAFDHLRSGNAKYRIVLTNDIS